MGAYQKLGYEPKLTAKGGVLVPLGGRDKENAVLLEAHIDTLGAMVAEIKVQRQTARDTGRRHERQQCRGERTAEVRHPLRRKRSTTEPYSLTNASIHVNGEYNDTKRSI